MGAFNVLIKSCSMVFEYEFEFNVVNDSKEDDTVRDDDNDDIDDDDDD